MHRQVCSSDELIHFHLAFLVKPQCRWEEKSARHLHFPHHCNFLIFGPYIFIYFHPNHIPHGQNGGIFYTIGTPFLKPLIYTLRNTEVKNAMRKLWHVKITSENKWTNCRPGLIIYWVMIYLNLYRYQIL